MSTQTIECPGCGLVREVDRFRRTAGEFCARCDYPLFFMPAATERYAVELGDRSEVDRALRRIPGDRHRLVTEACPACSERNPLGAITCLRCGALMHPPPPPPPPPPEPVYVAAPIEAPPRSPIPVLAIVVAVILALALLIILVRW